MSNGVVVMKATASACSGRNTVIVIANIVAQTGARGGALLAAGFRVSRTALMLARYASGSTYI